MKSTSNNNISFKSLQIGNKNNKDKMTERINTLTNSSIGHDLYYNTKDYLETSANQAPSLTGDIITRNDVNAKLTVEPQSDNIKVEITDIFDQQLLSTIKIFPSRNASNMRYEETLPGHKEPENRPFSLINKTAQDIVSLLSEIAVKRLKQNGARLDD